MQSSCKAWQHIIINTRGSWLTGDPRGFRSRNHRKHSTGDYKNPPPAQQYDGLHRHIRSGSRSAVRLPQHIWKTIGQQILDKAEGQGHEIQCMSVDGQHVHLLVELPNDRSATKRIVGSWKQRASHAVRDRLPGEIWSKSCDPIGIMDREHYQRVFNYIMDHASAGAWTWSSERGQQQ